MIELLDRIPVDGGLQVVVGTLAIIVATVIVAMLVKLLLFAVGTALAARTKTDLDNKLLNAVRGHLYLLVYLGGMALILNYLEARSDELIPDLFRLLDGVTYALVVVIVAHMIVRVVGAILDWYGSAIAGKTDTNVDDEFLPLLDRATKVIVYTLSLLIVLDRFEVDIKGLITVLGVGSLAVALAAQDTIANMIGGFVIMIDRPFRKGDRVRLGDGTACVVESIGIRSAKFRTFDNTLIIWPNSEIVKSEIHNLTYPYPQIRVVVNVGVGYNSDINYVRQVMLEEARKHPRVLDDPAPSFAFLDFGDSSLDVSVRCRVADVADQFGTGSALREQILNRFRQEDIEIPFPQRVVTTIEGEAPKKAPIPDVTTAGSTDIIRGGQADDD